MTKYIHQVVRRLNCSGKKREEIKKQLTADFLAAEENGEKAEDIIKRMGNPAEMAEEFNRNFSDSEKKKYKREKWTKRVSVAAVILILFGAVLYWALPKTTPIAESKIFQEDQVEKRAKEVIRQIGAEDYESLRACSDEKIKAILNDGFIEDAKKNFGSDWGELSSYGNSYIVQTSQMGKTYAVVQMNTSFENTGVTFTLSFDKDMKLAGLYMK